MAPVITSTRGTKCETCPFYGAKVGTRGPEDSPFMIIGESPGRSEVREGVPFVGVSWKVLKDALDRTGLDYPEPYITNAFHCWPGTKPKTENNLNAACSSCHPALVDEINAHPRKLVLTLGSPSLRSVTNDFGLKITKERGKYIKPMLGPEIRGVEHAVATIHPAFILRGGGNTRQFRGDIQYALTLLNGGNPKRNPDVEYLVCDNATLLLQLYRALAAKPRNTDVAADLETGSSPDDPNGAGGFNFVDDSILMAGLSYRPDQVYIIPEDAILHPITRRIFQLQKLNWIWHNGKFDIKFLWSYGIKEAKVDDDTMLMSYCLDERGGVHDLETVSHDWLAAPNWKGMLNSYKKAGQSYRVIPKPILYKYAAYDISNTLRLAQIMRRDILSDPNNKKLYYKTLIPASAYLATVEDWGINVDQERVRQNDERLTRLAYQYAGPLYRTALSCSDIAYPDDKELPAEPKEIAKLFDQSEKYDAKLPNSPQQLAKLLFDDLRLPNKGFGRSTGKDALEALPDHPAVNSLRQYRKVAKQLGTYVRPLIDRVDEKGRLIKSSLFSDGRMHTTFKIHGTATGRLASGDPMNVQNIPRDADIRGQFIPTANRIFIEPDLSQAELRSLAAMSGDPALCEIYLNPNSVGLHDKVRADNYGNPEDWSQRDLQRYIDKFYIRTDQPEEEIIKAILDEQKMRAKNVNFGIVYGIMKYGLAEQIEGTAQEAQAMLDRWAESFPVAWAFINACKNAPRKGQDLVTPFGNRKRHWVVTEENIHALQNEAANFPHQSTASHIMLHGGIRVYRDFLKHNVRIANTVHDSMLIDCPDDYDLVCAVTDHVVKVLEQVPRDWGITRIPFVADAKMGYRWGRAYMISYDKYKAKHTTSQVERGKAL